MRAVEIDAVNSIRIFSDNSSLEIFLNDGEEVFSTRIYNDYIDRTLTLIGEGIVKIEKWNL
ncbi:GH32 C-terminal domain-containing protein [Clostridium sp.]|nr:GH32 C-terminal domain-containing protein [Clostridium sp.]MDU2157238.1 GH32 C-terminal domain-containing protein [Clostridium sp.]